MLEAVVVAVRWLQYGGAVVLLGLPLFILYSFKGSRAPSLTWARPMLIAAAVVVALGSLAALVAQTAVMAGSLSEAVKPASLSFMVAGTALGMAMAARAALAVIGLAIILALRPGRTLWSRTVVIGLVVAASFAWTGHGAATAGPGGTLHLVADIMHAVAAAVWFGALAAFMALLLRRQSSDDTEIYRSLHRFAGLGTSAVAVLVFTGLVNSWFLIGPARVGELPNSLYGQLLIAKLGLFALMLALAAGNRFTLTPRLGVALSGGEDSRPALRRLRHSILAETAVGALLLAAVSIMGILAPPSAM